MMKSIPGDPFTDNKALPPEIHLALRAHYGLEDSLSTQYLRYLTAISTFDFGPSYRYKDLTVNDIIQQGFPISATLGLEAMVIALIAGISLGVIAALRRTHWIDHAAMVSATIGVSVPSFITAALLQYVIALKLGLLPVARWGTFAHTILPALSLAAMPTAIIARLVRANMIEVLHQDYIKTAKAKGLPLFHIIMRHALCNACAPILPFLGQLTANILIGSFVIEKIYGIPGLGQWFVNSVTTRDYTVVMGMTIFYSIILLSALFLSEKLHQFLDPRIKEKQ